jgi:protein-S-isoprenylcysteine O-methyltransferase Ste14
VTESKSYNRVLGTLRVVSVYVLVALLVWISRPTPLSVTVGFVFVALGEAIRFWAAGHLRKTVELITSGPYRYSRNPLYLGRLLIFTGVCVMAWVGREQFHANLLVLVLGWAVFFLYYFRRKERVEPARLREVHGEIYERYFRAVPALFPTLKPYPEGASVGWSSERMLRNREHWMVIGLALLTLLMLWRAYSLQL